MGGRYVGEHARPGGRARLFQKADDVGLVVLYAFRPFVLFQFRGDRICLADAHGALVAVAELVGPAARDDEHRRRVGDLGRKRENLKAIGGLFAAENGV